MDRVEHRAGVRLDRDAVVRPERVEIERGHDRGHRRAARLVPADLQPVVTVADVVGVVDGPGRQPAQPVVEDLERFDVGGGGLEHDRRTSRLVRLTKTRPPRALSCSASKRAWAAWIVVDIVDRPGGEAVDRLLQRWPSSVSS